MTVEFRVDKEEGIAYGILKGEVDVDQVIAGLTVMVSSEDFRPGLNGITDLRDMIWESDQDDLRTLVHFMIENRERIGSSKSAIVVTSDRAYGMARMFEVFSEESSINVRVFRDFDEAKRWVIEGDNEEA